MVRSLMVVVVHTSAANKRVEDLCVENVASQLTTSDALLPLARGGFQVEASTSSI
jgi:hypothetical protein